MRCRRIWTSSARWMPTSRGRIPLSQAFLTPRPGASGRRPGGMDGGGDRTAASQALARFARGLQDDLTAIIAGLTLEWSNGVTEGQIHRLKLVKRQGYGRAGFALLRQRVLQAA